MLSIIAVLTVILVAPVLIFVPAFNPIEDHASRLARRPLDLAMQPLLQRRPPLPVQRRRTV